MLNILIKIKNNVFLIQKTVLLKVYAHIKIVLKISMNKQHHQFYGLINRMINSQNNLLEHQYGSVESDRLKSSKIVLSKIIFLSD